MIATEAIKHILEAEGGYVHDPADAGGETNFGISKRSYPDLDIKALTKADAAQIYLLDYWQPLRCHDLPPGVRLSVMDAGVNQGRRQAVKLLQICTGATVDGIIGPQTVAATIAHPDHMRLVDEFTFARIAKYVSIVRRRFSQRRFLANWVYRALKVRDITRGL